MRIRRRARGTLLGLLAVGFAAWHWGPQLYWAALPLPEAAVKVGGEWRTVTTPEGGTIRFVAHRIDRYCFSPGVGTMQSIDSVPADSLLRVATALVDAMAPEALRDGRPNITVLFQFPSGSRWPWAPRTDVMITFHHGGVPASWKATSYSAQLGRSARGLILAYNDSSRARAARAQDSTSPLPGRSAGR